ncbi:hypothetical protein HJG60_017563 [Phyllostomus discolor]|uniref:Uncharacterized protein n=1 Tax=Phyllostomus discolor TaxID=89673 RepID=A0A834A7G6_9CHIR|nr:hypothetical protein HJG60_017563 [Phyllostomus discolor]
MAADQGLHLYNRGGDMRLFRSPILPSSAKVAGKCMARMVSCGLEFSLPLHDSGNAFSVPLAPPRCRTRCSFGCRPAWMGSRFGTWRVCGARHHTWPSGTMSPRTSVRTARTCQPPVSLARRLKSWSPSI